MHEVATHAHSNKFFKTIFFVTIFLKLQQVFAPERSETNDGSSSFRMHLKVPSSSSVHCWDYIVDMKAQNVPRRVEISIHWHVETFRSQINQLFITQLLPKFAFATELHRQDRP
jgi:hypothetical protein